MILASLSSPTTLVFKPSEPMVLFFFQRRWKGGEIVEGKEGEGSERMRIEFLFNFFCIFVLKKVDRHLRGKYVNSVIGGIIYVDRSCA
jgi:hypothetical protein